MECHEKISANLEFISQLLCIKFQGSIEAGKAKSLTCAACHGADGNSLIPINPKLAGQHAKYLEKQLKDLKLGGQTGGKQGRYDPAMSAILFHCQTKTSQIFLLIIRH